MRKATAAAAGVWVVLGSCAAWAGTGYQVSCQDAACRYSAESVVFGGGMFHDALTGYCVKCARFVQLTWDRGKPAPQPLARAWDAETGRSFPLYGCPRCKSAFLPIPDEKALRHCPKCSRPTLQKKAVLAVD